METNLQVGQTYLEEKVMLNCTNTVFGASTLTWHTELIFCFQPLFNSVLP